MTTKEWLEKAREHQAILTTFIADWHPARPSEKSLFGEHYRITASIAETACVAVREKIKEEEISKPAPVQRFLTALETDDVDEAYSLLNSAWFGVPESTSCWRIPGFSRAVDLLEDPPEPEEGELIEGSQLFTEPTTDDIEWTEL